MNILIMGLPKSGTSGLAMMIFTAFPGCVRNLERIQYVKDEELAQGNVICKELIDHPNKIGLHGKHYVKYDRLVKIVRDPRDRLVSGILYGGFNTIVDKLDVRDHFLERLRAKEADPMSVNCTELVSILKIKAKTNHPFVNKGEIGIWKRDWKKKFDLFKDGFMDALAMQSKNLNNDFFAFKDKD